MTTTLTTSTEDVDIKSVGLSWLQDNLADYVFNDLPLCRTRPIAEGFDGIVNYYLPSLSNFLVGGKLHDWRAGEELPPDRNIGASLHTVTVRSRAAYPLSRNTRSSKSRLADLDNIVPGLMVDLYQGAVKDLAAYIQNASVYGTAKTFSGTDPLGDADSDGSQQPLADIENELFSIRLYARAGFKVVCIMTTDTLDILRRHVNYHGAGTGSGAPSAMPEDAFVRAFQAIHRLAEVHVIDVAVNTAEHGQTATIARPDGGGVLWFGVCDRRAREWDMTGDTTGMVLVPDGALNVWKGDDFFIDSHLTGKRTERFFGTVDIVFDAPRGSTMGFFFDAATILPSS